VSVQYGTHVWTLLLITNEGGNYRVGAVEVPIPPLAVGGQLELRTLGYWTWYLAGGSDFKNRLPAPKPPLLNRPS